MIFFFFFSFPFFFGPTLAWWPREGKETYPPRDQYVDGSVWVCYPPLPPYDSHVESFESWYICLLGCCFLELICAQTRLKTLHKCLIRVGTKKIVNIFQYFSHRPLRTSFYIVTPFIGKFMGRPLVSPRDHASDLH